MNYSGHYSINTSKVNFVASSFLYEPTRNYGIARFLTIVFISILYFSPLNGQKISILPEVRMLALGDSYTIGQNVEENGRWPHQFIDELITRGVSGNYPDYIATTGWTTKNLLQGIETNLDKEKQYNLVSILIGVNNQYQGLSIDSYEPDLRKIIDTALETVSQDKSKVFILSIPDYAFTPFGGGNSSISLSIDDYNRIKKRVAIEYGINYIDITGISREGLNDPSLVASDGLHPSEEQYKKWVEAIVPYLKINNTVNNNDQRQDPLAYLRIFPNPVSSAMHIESPVELSHIRILSANGSIVFEQGINSVPLIIDLSFLPPGMYTAIADHARTNKYSSQKIIIQKNN